MQKVTVQRAMTVMLALSAACAAISADAAGKIVCWTDKDGHRACGDRVPPEYATTERQVYDKSGRVVETMRRQLTPEEARAAEAAAEAQAAERKRKEEQAAYDKFLVTTFADVNELEKTRDNRLSMIDGQIRLAEKSQNDTKAGIEDLQKQVQAAEKEHGKAPPKLTKNLASFQKTLADNQRALDKLKQDRVNTAQKYASDIARYRQLKGLPPAEEAPAPAEAPAAGEAQKK